MPMRILYTTLLLAVLSATALAQNPCDDLNAGFQVTVDGPVAIFHTGSNSNQHYICAPGCSLAFPYVRHQQAKLVLALKMRPLSY